MRLSIVFIILSLGACGRNETVANYGAADKTWVLTEIDNQPYAAHATLLFTDNNKISGDTPCNAYSGMMTVPYPWFEAVEITSTKMACPDKAKEAQFLEALSMMTLSEVLGDVLLLSNDAGREMVFKAAD